MFLLNISYVFLLLLLAASGVYIVDSYAAGNLVPEWVKNTAQWYGEGKISETEFLNAIKYLIDNNIILLERVPESKATVANIVIPNGNSQVGNMGFYIPLSLEVSRKTTVVWINDDNIEHTVVSQDAEGNVIPLFNSKGLKTGERFIHKFDEPGVYHYFCSIHPWRVGVVTVS